MRILIKKERLVNMKDMMKIGKFEVTSPQVIVTDPCYELGNSGTYIINNAATGDWNGYITLDSDERVEKLIAIHESQPSKNLNDSDFNLVQTVLWVDSGQMAICNLADYRNLEYLTITNPDIPKFEYDKYCRVTLGEQRAGLIGEYVALKPYYSKDFSLYAIASQSGYGDGEYTLRVVTTGTGVKAQTVAIMVEF